MKRIAVMLFMSAVFTSGCSGTKWVQTPVTDQFNFNVVLEHAQKKGVVVPQKYEHPFAIEASELEKLMKDLKYTYKSGLGKKERQGSVFQTEEIDRLAPVLVDTLGKADTNQRIRFVSFSQGKAWLFSTPQKTEGIIFVRPPKQLNIAFNFINVKRSSSETTAIDPIFSTADPLKIKATDTPLSATVPYVKLQKLETGERVPMWAAADLEKLKESISAMPASEDKVTEDSTPKASQRIDIKNDQMEKTMPTPAPEVIPEADIKNKLKFLKELLDDGLISDDDYDAKKKELLDKIN